MRLLLVEDDSVLAAAVLEVLRDESYAVDRAANGRDADELVAINDYDLVILDWGIPGPNGLVLLQRWRAAGRAMPVLMLTGRSGVADRVDGLDTGADDYLTKPFAFDELLARTRSLLRRASQRPQLAELTAGDVSMERASHRVWVGDVEVELTPKEFAILEFLLQRRDEVVTRSEISDHAWDEGFDPASNVVDVTVHRLRRKIDGDHPKRLLHTVKGVGYVLKAERA